MALIVGGVVRLDPWAEQQKQAATERPIITNQTTEVPILTAEQQASADIPSLPQPQILHTAANIKRDVSIINSKHRVATKSQYLHDMLTA
jgi:hypothetical protein